MIKYLDTHRQHVLGESLLCLNQQLDRVVVDRVSEGDGRCSAITLQLMCK